MNPLGLLSRVGVPALPGTELVVDLGVQALFQGRRARAYGGLVALAQPRPGDTVLDIGSGTGYLTTLLAQRVAPGGAAIGVEPSEAAVARARRRAVEGCRFEVGSALALPVADNAADLVTSCLLIHHIDPEHRRAAVREMARALRPGGRLFVADLKRLDNPLVNAGAGVVVPCFAAALTQPALVELVTAGGFRVEQVGEYWGRMHYVSAMHD